MDNKPKPAQAGGAIAPRKSGQLIAAVKKREGGGNRYEDYEESGCAGRPRRKNVSKEPGLAGE
jgi:hypothetical protein